MITFAVTWGYILAKTTMFSHRLGCTGEVYYWCRELFGRPRGLTQLFFNLVIVCYYLANIIKCHPDITNETNGDFTITVRESHIIKQTITNDYIDNTLGWTKKSVLNLNVKRFHENAIATIFSVNLFRTRVCERERGVCCIQMRGTTVLKLVTNCRLGSPLLNNYTMSTLYYLTRRIIRNRRCTNCLRMYLSKTIKRANLVGRSILFLKRVEELC